MSVARPGTRHSLPPQLSPQAAHYWPGWGLTQRGTESNTAPARYLERETTNVLQGGCQTEHPGTEERREMREWSGEESQSHCYPNTTSQY